MDLLRPGTVPISPDTVLWFEFLLDQDLLLKHLQKPGSEPSPIELIIRFSNAIYETLRNRPECENGEPVAEFSLESETKHPAKNIALKCLSLKVAAYLKWSVDEIRLLPFKTQINLLQDLLYFANERKFVDIPNIPDVDLTACPEQYLFALVIYHRWLLSITMHRINTNLLHRMNICEIYPNDENFICTPENVEKTVKFLTEALNWENIPNMLTYECIKLPTQSEDHTDIDWLFSEPISKLELYSQINYDLGTFFFYKENYELAKQHFENCINCFRNITVNNGFINFDKEKLEVYLKACSGAGEHKGDLLDQLNSSIFNNYMGLTSILQQDNIKREIPLVHRMNLELHIQGALSSGTFTVARDFLYKVRALNIIRFVLDKKHVFNHSTISSKNINTLIWALQISWKNFPEEDKNLLKMFIMELIFKDDIPNLHSLIQSSDVLCNIFTKADINYIKKSKTEILDIPESLSKTNWTIYDTNKKKKPKLELRQLQQQLISSYDYKFIRELVHKIASSGASVWEMNPKWELPIPLQSVLKSLPRGYLQEFGFVLLAKAKEQMLNKNWNSSLELLIILDKEIQDSQSGSFSKLSRLVSWEILLVQITQLLDDWPKNTVDKHALANACEGCLQSNESVLPRTEIMEQCVVCLLNLGRWEFLINLEKRWQFTEISSGIALACQELVKHKGTKKLPKNLWDSVLPIFLASQSKRSNAGSCLYQDSQLTGLKNSITNIFSKLRDSIALTVVISMLTRLHNILKDEPSVELQLESVLLWPAVVSNANSYNIKGVCETLSQIVTLALTFYPTNVPWLRLLGDINFANNHYRIALNYYLKSLLIYNDYFNIPVRNDDHVFRRMIKCCSSLGCHTQAAVLCQFLEEPDYVLAFRILSDQKSCNDAVDAYYHCFWDINILEYLIHNHHKKGEFQRRKCAIQVMGLLELNSSNNEEIQREASNLRKSTFLRALCKQYVFT